MANGTAAPSGAPSWLQPLVQVVSTLGFPIVIAGLLLWFILFRLDATLRVIENSEENRVAAIISVKSEVVGALERQTKTMDEDHDLLIAALDRQTEAFKQAIQQNVAAIETNRVLLTQSLQRPAAPPP